MLLSITHHVLYSTNLPLSGATVGIGFLLIGVVLASVAVVWQWRIDHNGQ